MTGTLVVGFDGSDPAEDALSLGLRLGHATGDRLVVAAVFPGEYESGMGRVDAEWVAYMREQAREVLEHARGLVGDEPGVELRPVGSSSAARGLHDLAEAERATMIVVGSTHRAPRRRMFPGSTGEGLLHGSSSPVAVAPRGLHERPPTELRTVACAFVDTPDAHEALTGAAALARRVGARLRVVSVVGRVAEFSVFAKTDSERAFTQEMRSSFGAALDRAVAGLPEGLDVEAELLEGDPVETLAAFDERDADLLVCGSRGYGPVRRVLLGGVASRLVRRAAAPIVVVPRGAGGALAGSPREEAAPV